MHGRCASVLPLPGRARGGVEGRRKTDKAARYLGGEEASSGSLIRTCGKDARGGRWTSAAGRDAIPFKRGRKRGAGVEGGGRQDSVGGRGGERRREGPSPSKHAPSEPPP